MGFSNNKDIIRVRLHQTTVSTCLNAQYICSPWINVKITQQSPNPVGDKSLSLVIKSRFLKNLIKGLTLSLVTQNNQWTKLHS